jgi:hypothetical protein
VTALNDAVQRYSETTGDGTLHRLAAMLVFEQAEVTVGDGVADSGYCGVMAAGTSEWRISATNAVAGPWRTALTDANGFLDVDPADGLNDATGETRDQMLDRLIKVSLKQFVDWKKAGDVVQPTPTDPFDDDPN